VGQRKTSENTIKHQSHEKLQYGCFNIQNTHSMSYADACSIWIHISIQSDHRF